MYMYIHTSYTPHSCFFLKKSGGRGPQSHCNKVVTFGCNFRLSFVFDFLDFPVLLLVYYYAYVCTLYFMLYVHVYRYVAVSRGLTGPDVKLNGYRYKCGIDRVDVQRLQPKVCEETKPRVSECRSSDGNV